LLGNASFFVCNCDGILIDAPGKTGAFQKLIAAWDSTHLDVLMLVHPLDKAHGFDGPGDFFVDDKGNMTRRGQNARAPYVYAGAWITHPRLFAGQEAVPFSANTLWDRAIGAGRMRAVVHDGDWFHVGTPEAVDDTARLLAHAA